VGVWILAVGREADKLTGGVAESSENS